MQNFAVKFYGQKILAFYSKSSMSNTKIYKIITKKDLEAIQFNSDDKIKLEGAKQKIHLIDEASNIIVNYSNEKEYIEEFAKEDDSYKIQEKKFYVAREEKCNAKTLDRQISNLEGESTENEIEIKEVNKSYKNSIKPKNSNLTKYLLDRNNKKKLEVQKLEEQIKILEDKLNLCIKRGFNQSTIGHLRELIYSNKRKLSEVIESSYVKIINSKGTSSISIESKFVVNKTSQKLDRNLKICIYCNASVLEKRLATHMEAKCPKRPAQTFDDARTDDRHWIQEKALTTEVSSSNIELERISWTLLPQGEWHFTELKSHFRHLALTPKWKNKLFDENRLLKIEKKLKPAKCFIGKDEFDGYIVYCFDWTANVILECPIYGNAIYIIKKGKSNWQEIAKTTKWEARTKYSSQIKVINHNKTWLERLEQNLRYLL